MAGEIGAELRIGIEAAFDHHNRQGGVQGREIILEALDDVYDPETALENVVQLLDVKSPTYPDLEIDPDPVSDEMGANRVFGFIGNTGTATAIEAYNYVGKQKVIFFAPMTGTSVLRGNPPKEWLFHFRASYRDEAAYLVNYFYNTKKIQTDHIWVFCQSDGFGIDALDGVIDALKDVNFNITSADDLEVVEYYDKTAYEESVSAAALRLQSKLQEVAGATPEGSQVEIAIIMADAGGAGIKFLQEVRGWLLSPDHADVSSKVKVNFGRLSIANKTLADGLKTQSELYDGLISTQVVPLYNQDAEALRIYRERLQSYCDQHECSGEPSFTSLEGYLAAEVFARALKKHWERKRPLTSEAFKQTLESFTTGNHIDLGLCSTSECYVTFSPTDHQALEKVWLTRLERKKDEQTNTWVPIFKNIEDEL
ncbi:ABC transporter substrate-binding protein [Myxococcota bacterium]|nr:ABC transporter substrate-binding protein [Myxococcota bacterium]